MKQYHRLSACAFGAVLNYAGTGIISSLCYLIKLSSSTILSADANYHNVKVIIFKN